jgi:hypothetical protein
MGEGGERRWWRGGGLVGEIMGWAVGALWMQVLTRITAAGLC